MSWLCYFCCSMSASIYCSPFFSFLPGPICKLPVGCFTEWIRIGIARDDRQGNPLLEITIMPISCHFLLSLFHDCKIFGHKLLFIATVGKLECIVYDTLVSSPLLPIQCVSVNECLCAYVRACVCVCVCVCARVSLSPPSLSSPYYLFYNC